MLRYGLVGLYLFFLECCMLQHSGIITQKVVNVVI